MMALVLLLLLVVVVPLLVVLVQLQGQVRLKDHPVHLLRPSVLLVVEVEQVQQS